MDTLEGIKEKVGRCQYEFSKHAEDGRLGTLLTMLNNSIAVADRMEPTIQES